MKGRGDRARDLWSQRRAETPASTIAILGATGQIAKGLIRELGQNHDLALFARRPEAVNAFLDGARARRCAAAAYAFEDFGRGAYDVVINAAGPGDPRAIRKAGSDVLAITERLDALVLDYLRRRPESLYVFFSTGAIYGEDYAEARREEPHFQIGLDEAAPEGLYAFAKLAAELRHRALGDYRIADVRIFGYVSRDIDPAGGFLLSEIVRALIDKQRFVTDARDFVRDYIGPEDLAQLIGCLTGCATVNDAFDIYSAEPTTKFEILSALGTEHGLDYEIAGAGEGAPVPVPKPAAITFRDRAREIGYAPRYGSKELVLAEIGRILEEMRGESAVHG